MYRSRIKGDLEVLSKLLGESDKVKGWGVIQGYGLKDSDFEKFKNCSRRMFNHRKAEFLKSKFITPLKSKGKRSKYSITPLGITYLCQNQKELTENQAKKIFEQLRIFYKKSGIKQGSNVKLIEKTTKKIWGSLSGIIGVNELHESLADVFDCIKIVRSEDTFEVKLSYPIFNEGTLNFRKFVFNKEKVMELYHKSKTSSIITARLVKDDLSFFYYLSEFILLVLQYHVLNNILDSGEVTSMKSKNNDVIKRNNIMAQNAVKQIKELQKFEPDILLQAKLLGQEIQSLLDANNTGMIEINTIIESKTRVMTDVLY